MGRVDICKRCVWHKAEEENIMPFKKHVRFCDMEKKYTVDYSSCKHFHEELFEAKSNSTQTKEYSLDLETYLDKEKLETR